MWQCGWEVSSSDSLPLYLCQSPLCSKRKDLNEGFGGRRKVLSSGQRWLFPTFKMMFAFIFKVNLVRWTVPFSQRQRMKSSDHRSDAGLAEAMQDFFTPDPNLIQKIIAILQGLLRNQVHNNPRPDSPLEFCRS
ncbi:unnamed protein product [Caretta caretta]